MTILRVQPETLRRLATVIRALHSGSHREALGRLYELHRGLQESWSSEAQTALETAFGGWLARFDRQASGLLPTAAFLNAAAAGYDALEARLMTDPPDELTIPASGGGHVRHRPVAQGNGPVVSGPVSTTGGCLAAQTFNGIAAVGRPIVLTNVRLTYRADYALDYFADRVVVQLTQYPSTNQVVTPTHWSTSATVITRSGREILYNIDALDPNPIARAEAATLTLPIDPNDPPVRVDLYITNVADGPAGALPSRQFYNSFKVNVPAAAANPTHTAPFAPTPTPNPAPGLEGPRPIPNPRTPTPVPGPVLTPQRPSGRV